ncbi:DMT family transporter [Sphingomonas abietis]|uniref:DMT family transporter n=1 Tax=Sphingomonas abietis TaxID=3012344 RepID=A0ABY7NGU9_9SPHN|nr:DMT family transporter [Sphingomonas abietis]WBO20772.1 DMT family transporter [Sphingomonas abietis]
MTAAQGSSPWRDAASPRRDRLSLWNSPYLLLTLAASLWASNFVLGRALPHDLPPVSLSFWRWTFAIPLALPFALPHLRRDWPEIRRGWPMLLALAALGLAGSNTLAYLALRQTSATSALLVQSAIPVTIVASGFLLFGDRVSGRQLMAIGFALSGVLAVILGRPGAAGSFDQGTLLAGAAMLSQSLYATLLRRRPRLHPASFLLLTFAGAAALMLPFQLLAGAPLPLHDRSGMAALAYLAIGPSVLAFFLFNRGVALIGSGRAGLFFYLMPVFGTIFATFALHEAIGPFELGGFALVGIGFLLSGRRQR